MKYGLIVHLKTRNIGDDIQSYAMEKFLPRVDYLIDREHLDSFYMKTGEKVAAILGGWYLKNPMNWPPSTDSRPKSSPTPRSTTRKMSFQLLTNPLKPTSRTKKLFTKAAGVIVVRWSKAC